MKIKIVIADDHQLFIDGLSSILNNCWDMEVVGQANNGIDLCRLMDHFNDKPHVIITDIRMPGMDGIAATRSLTLNFPKIPVLALSMHNQPEDVLDMIDAGARGFVVKNAGKDEMLKAIYTLHNGQTFFSTEISNEIRDQYQRGDVTNEIRLTRREKEILVLISNGKTSQQIALELNISKLTVDTHRKNVHKKLGTASSAGLIKYALKHIS